jgi:hypothetical protein
LARSPRAASIGPVPDWKEEFTALLEGQRRRGFRTALSGAGKEKECRVLPIGSKKRIAEITTIVVVSLSISGCSSLSSPALLPNTAHGSTAEGMARKVEVGRSRHKHFAGLIAGVTPRLHDPREQIIHGPHHEVAPPTDPRVEAEFKRLRSGSSSGSRQTRNVANGSDTAGQFGIYEYPNQSFHAGSFGYQTGYEQVEIGFMLLGTNVLYAPTNRAPGGNCLEIGSGYWAGQAKVYAYDFCDGTGKFHWLEDIDGNFRANFERDWGDGLPSYFYETYWNNSLNEYTVLLYNATQGYWVWEYNSAGSTVGVPSLATQGWNMFETHYFTGGACPPVLSAHGGGIQWLDPATNAWETIENVPGIVYNYHYGESGTDCINQDDGSGRGYWYSLSFPTGHDWYVDASPSNPPYTGGGGCDPVESDCCSQDGTCSCDLYNLQQCCDISGGVSCGDCGNIIYFAGHTEDCNTKGLSVRRGVNGSRRQLSFGIAAPYSTRGGRGS